MSKFAQVGDFCPNTACSDHGKPQSEHQQNIIKFGRPKSVDNASNAKLVEIPMQKPKKRSSIGVAHLKTKSSKR
jgi:hypothetical protein